MRAETLFIVDLKLSYAIYRISFSSFSPRVLVAILWTSFVGIGVLVIDVGIIGIFKSIKIKIGEIIRIGSLEGKAIVKVIACVKIAFDSSPYFIHIARNFFSIGSWIDIDIVYIPVYIIGIVIGI